MDVTNMTSRQKNCLKRLKRLEGKTMKMLELEACLDSIACFEENDWYFTDEDYNDYTEDNEVENVLDMVHSGDEIECPEPYIAPDGSEQHWNGENMYEIWFTHDGDPECHPADDEEITITDVDIHIPDEYWK